MLKKAEEMTTLCNLINCNLLLAGFSKKVKGYSVKHVKEKTIKRLKRLLDLGGNYKVNIGFEPVGFFDSVIRKVDEAVYICQFSKSEKCWLSN